MKPYNTVETAQPILQEQNVTKIPQLYSELIPLGSIPVF